MFVIHIDDDGDYRVPPMTIQMLIENAIKHNVISTRQPLKMNLPHHATWLLC
jgi:LytS/YehU family sensor histidine kinase